jgi:NitT/TauT family transport system substrate-binding protein
MITNETTIEEHPDLVRAMVRASLRGLQDVIDDPAAAFEICKEYVEGLDQADQEVQRRVLEESIGFWRSERPGYSDPAAWENMQQVLLAMGSLEAPIDILSAYSNEFIP